MLAVAAAAQTKRVHSTLWHVRLSKISDETFNDKSIAYLNKKSCIIGLVADPERLSDIRRNRVAIMKEQRIKEYTDLESIKKEVEDS